MTRYSLWDITDPQDSVAYLLRAYLDRIEQLEAENEQLRADLKAQCELYRHDAAKWMDENAQLQAENKILWAVFRVAYPMVEEQLPDDGESRAQSAWNKIVASMSCALEEK